ncbi:MAG: YciI family protein [Rhodobiaceae bacterium]|nr:YciI family protein [Rhodobiaceae bacterium]
MLFAFIATDHDGVHEKRLATRPDHVAWLKSLGDTLKLAGPFLDPARDISNGSLVVIEAADEAGARAIMAEDPYAKVGLFKHTELRPWAWTINAPENL